jgi:hypothetical protein
MKQKTLQERADAYAEWDCEFIKEDASLDRTHSLAASSGSWLFGYRAAVRDLKKRKKETRCSTCGHAKSSHAMEYGRGGALCRSTSVGSGSCCACEDYKARKRKKK